MFLTSFVILGLMKSIIYPVAMNTDASTALALLASLPFSLTDVARLMLELVEGSGGSSVRKKEALLLHCRRVIALGCEAEHLATQTVSFSKAVAETLRVKADRSALTLRDIRSFTQRMMRDVPDLAARPMRSMTTADCAAVLEKVFLSPSQRRHARAILSGVFTVAWKKGWCAHNPVRLVDVPRVTEREIVPLRIEEVRRLLRTAEREEFSPCAAGVAMMLYGGIRPYEVRRLTWCAHNPVRLVDVPRVTEREIVPLRIEEVRRLLRTAEREEFSPCAAGVAMMLYGGIRPYEVRRLTWGDVDWEEGEVRIRPRQSKTGGGRQVPLSRSVLAWLRSYYPQGAERESVFICPPDWNRRWRALRSAAGFQTWRQDVLRHTFASYHAKMFHDWGRLQAAMGHRDGTLLQTRYVHTQGIRGCEVRAFWELAA